MFAIGHRMQLRIYCVSIKHRVASPQHERKLKKLTFSDHESTLSIGEDIMFEDIMFAIVNKIDLFFGCTRAVDGRVTPGSSEARACGDADTVMQCYTDRSDILLLWMINVGEAA